MAFGLTPMLPAGTVTQNVSTSQVKTKRLCLRKWAMAKLYLIKEPEKHHLLVGKVFHSIAERYLSREAKTWEDLFPVGWDKGLIGGENLWARRMAEEAVTQGLWQAKDGISIEYPVALLVGQEHCVNGLPLMAAVETADVQGIRRVVRLTSLIDGRPLPPTWNRLPPLVGFIDMMDLTSEQPEIIDQKSSKSRKYTLSPAKLALDVQMLNYAAVALNLVPSADIVKLRHNCFLKSPDEETPVFATRASTSRQAVIEHWRSIIRDVEDMQTARRIAPIITAGRPEERAKNAHLLQAAHGTPQEREACNAYGGCPFRDYCSGRCDHKQIVARLDAGGQSASAAPITFGLVPSTYKPRVGALPTTRPQEIIMNAPALQQAFQMYQEVFICNPQSPATQFRGIVVNAGTPPSVPPMIDCFPDASVEPDIDTLPREYTVQPPVAWVSASSWPNAALMGYAAAMQSAGSVAPAWTPAKTSRLVKPAPPVSALLPSASASASTPGAALRPGRDGQFGLSRPAALPASVLPPMPPPAQPQTAAAGVLAPGVGSALLAQQQRVAADAVAHQPPPAEGYVPMLGDVIEVKQNDHSFWGPLSGHQGLVIDVSAGETCPMLTITMNGQEYESVASSRFKLVSRAAAPVTPPAPVMVTPVAVGGQFGAPRPATPAEMAEGVGQVPGADPALQNQQTLAEVVVTLKGQNVSLKLANVPVPFNGVLEEVMQDAQGLYIEMFKQSPKPLKAYLTTIESVKVLTAEDVPPTKAPKKGRKPKDGAPVATVPVADDVAGQLKLIREGLKAISDIHTANIQAAFDQLAVLEGMLRQGKQ